MPQHLAAHRSPAPMMTTAEVAHFLHVHENTVKRLGDRGLLTFYRVMERGDRRYTLDDVMKFVRATTEQPRT